MHSWHHGHSIGVGVLGGLLVASHLLLFLLLAFLAGLACSKVLTVARGFVRTLRLGRPPRHGGDPSWHL